MPVPLGKVLTSVIGDPREGARFDLADAQDTAYRALTAAQNARQMVLNRDPRLDSATTAVQSLPATLAQAASEHATLQASIDAEISARKAADAALQALVDALAARPTSTYRKKSVSQAMVLALGAATDVAVTWDSPMPSTDYACWVVLTGAGGLAAIDPPAIKSQTAAGCVVTIRSRLALTATVTFTAHGLRVA